MRSRVRTPSLGVLALVLLAFAWLVTPAAGSIAIPISDDDPIAHADAIVLGHVTAIESHSDASGDINTYITVGIEEVLKGDLTGSDVTLKERGGTVGDRHGWMFANPQFVVGERVVLFMDQRPDGTLRTFHLYLGKFTLLSDPASADLVAVRGLPRRVTVLPPSGTAVGVAPLGSVARQLDTFKQRIRDRTSARRPLASQSRRPLPMASAAVPTGGIVESRHDFRFLADPDPGDGPPDPNETLLRWAQPDSNTPVTMRIASEGEPAAPTSGFSRSAPRSARGAGSDLVLPLGRGASASEQSGLCRRRVERDLVSGPPR